MALAPELLAMLVDPEDKGALIYFPEERILYNERLKRRYEVTATDIPVLLIDDSTTVSDDEHAELVAKAKEA